MVLSSFNPVKIPYFLEQVQAAVEYREVFWVSGLRLKKCFKHSRGLTLRSRELKVSDEISVERYRGACCRVGDPGGRKSAEHLLFFAIGGLEAWGEVGSESGLF